jgi:alpha-tubulin suppressor-like RCC1 family protein
VSGKERGEGRGERGEGRGEREEGSGRRERRGETDCDSDVVHVTAGRDHVFARTKNGDTYCWGYNGDGQLGLGDLVSRTLPHKIKLPCQFTEVTCGGYLTFGITKNRELWITGRYTQNTFTRTEFSGVITVAAGLHHVMLVDSDGYLFGWGDNSSKQLGKLRDGAASSWELTKVGEGAGSAEEEGGIIALYCGSYHTMALCRSGALFMWGQVHLPSMVATTGDYTLPTPTKFRDYVFEIPRLRIIEELWVEIFQWIFLGRTEDESPFQILPVEVLFALVQQYFKYI